MREAAVRRYRLETCLESQAMEAHASRENNFTSGLWLVAIVPDYERCLIVSSSCELCSLLERALRITL